MSAGGAARRCGGRGGDEGTTLVELLVVMALTTVVLAAVGAVFVSATRSVRETQVLTNTQADARTAAEAMSRSLRVAVVPPQGAPTGPSSEAAVRTPFVSAAADSVSFFANVQRTPVTSTTSGPSTAPLVRAVLQAPSLITFAHDAGTGCITETRTPAVVNTGPDAAATPYTWPGPGTTKCLAATTQAPVFSYFTSGVIAEGAASSQLDSTKPVSASQAKAIVSVGFVLTVQSPTASDVAPTRVTDRVTLVNVLASQAG
ncbi:hypothetical protein FHN55_13280 [Streptomyces sp. NP160]|uniref:PilW family protein n=1 Tax=Streptomyces sp. NP160 TaxID=2586637 RepID=UPI001117E714|nr:hypothetical protein [Streptomyces sp. NP160]TNM64496.1 hypothetical protein FHN55_13280 [Streptomyces sp. NP160]